MLDRLGEIVAGLAEADEPAKSAAFTQLLRLSEADMRELFLRIDRGEVVLPVETADVIATTHSNVAEQVWPESTVFDRDADFSLTRFLIAFNRIDRDDAWWASGVAQLRRMMAAGRVTQLAEFVQLFQVALTRDEAFAITFAAHAVTDEKDAFKMAVQGNVPLVRLIAANAGKLAVEMGRLTRDVWLPAQIPAAEYAEVRDFSVSVLRGLYPQVWADGYAGYRRAVAAR